MRLSRTSLNKAVAAVALGTGVAAGTASAGLVYDLRFSDGSQSRQADAGTTYTLELWAQVSGTNATQSDEKLTNTYVNIVSTQVGGGNIVAGGLAAATVATPFDGAGFRAGGPGDLNSDGVIDWGSTSTAAANTNYMFTRTNTVGGELGGTTGQDADGIGPGLTWEWKIATFTVTAAAVGAGQTRFNIVKPAATSFVAVNYAVAAVDNVNFLVSQTNQQGAYTGSQGVTFMPIPEPASVGLLGVAAIGLLGRKRRK